MTKDLTPFRVTEQSAKGCRLRLKTGYAITIFISLRVLPWVILTAALFSATAMKEMAGQPWFGIFYAMLFGVSGWLLFSRYPAELIFSQGRFMRRLNLFYFKYTEEEQLDKDTTIEVKKVSGYRSAAWIFFIVQGSRRKKLFHVPIFLSENKVSRDNFISLFKTVSGVEKVTLIS